MNNFFRNVLGMVYVQESDHLIQIGGVKTLKLGLDIMSEWGTSRIEKNMFTRFTSSSITFPKFFAMDLHYMLKILMQKKFTHTGRRVIHNLLLQLEDNTFLSKIKNDPPKFLDRSKVSLFHKQPLPHQNEFFDMYEDRTQRFGLTGYLLSAAAGTGKTLTSLTLAEMIGASVVIIVAPKIAAYKVWDRHLKEEYKKPQKSWIAAEGKPYNHERFLIVHFEALEKTLEVVRHTNTSKPVVILDESHNLNNVESLRTQTFVELCQMVKCQHVIWSSGTPIKALGIEAIPLLRTIDPLFTPDVEERFKRIYGREAKKALEILRNRMGMISFRVEKKGVSDNKPTSHDVHVKLPNGEQYTLPYIKKEMTKFSDERREYYRKNFRSFEKIYEECIRVVEKKLETRESKQALAAYRSYIKRIRNGYDPVAMKDISAYCNNYELKVIIPNLPDQMKKDFKNARSVIKYVELKIMGEALGSVLGKKRAQCHIDMIPHIPFQTIIDQSVKKTVVFTSYVLVVNGVRDFLKKDGYEPIVVYGETTKDLPQHVTAFEKKPEANPLIATYQSLSTAVPLIVANTVIFVNQPFRDHEKIQAQARVDRLGQDTPVEFYNTLLDTGKEPNISTRANDILQWSREQVEAILGTEIPKNMFATMESMEESLNDIEYHYDRLIAIDRFCEHSLVDHEAALEEFA